MAEFNGTIGITKEDSICSYKPEKSLSNRTANCPICLVCSNVWEINISTHI